MKILEILPILFVTYIIALPCTQLITRKFHLTKEKIPKKKFLPTKKEAIYALIATVILALYMLKAGLFE